MADHTTMRATCLCKASTFTASVPNSSLPRPALICHCDSCRHVTGALGSNTIHWPGSLPDTATLTRYPFSDRVWQYFCTTCSTQMFAYKHAEEELYVSTGVLDQPSKLVRYIGHEFVGDTKDGGLSVWLPKINGDLLPKWSTAPDNGEQYDISAAVDTAHHAADTLLQAHCLCKGVSFSISRPSAKAGIWQPPPAYLFHPNPSGRNKDDTSPPWWIASGDRYLAAHCACESCRLAAGVDVVQWAYIPAVNITSPNGEPFRPDFGTIKSYNSSGLKRRYFCGRCGASVFWMGNAASELIDVAVGLLDAKSGARAEEWLGWNTQFVLYNEFAVHRELVQALTQGLEERK